jgi:hypothetical protein
MVSVIENWTDMKGTVLSFKQSQVFPNFLEVEITIEKAHAVRGFPNLLKNTAGKTLNIYMPKDLARQLQLESGRRISFRARGGMHEIFAHPDFARVLKDKSKT